MGNGQLEGSAVGGTEECDDGNKAGGDGCDPELSARERLCVSGRRPACEKCGNGFKESSEACDDGNTLAATAAMRNVRLESGWTARCRAALRQVRQWPDRARRGVR